MTLSVADLDQSAAFLSDGLGMPASGAALRRPEHEALWGLPGAATRSQVFDAGDVLVEVVQYLDPVGRPRPDDYRISDQGILNVALGTRSKSQFDELYRRARAAGARPNSTPLRIPGAAVVYVNDPQQFSVELMRMSRFSDKHWGFTPIAIDRRPQPDTHAIEQTVHIAAPPDVTWHVISDHEAMSEWAGIGPVRRIADGETEPDGRGAQRMLNIGGKIIEQVIAATPPDSSRYRIIQGSPFVCHQGELSLRPHGDGTAVTWTIRFRPRIPGTGRLIAAGFSRALNRMMTTRLRRHAEHLAHGPGTQHSPQAFNRRTR